MPHHPDGAAGRPSCLAMPPAAAAPSGGRSGRSGPPFVSPRASPDLPSWSHVTATSVQTRCSPPDTHPPSKLLLRPASGIHMDDLRPAPAHLATNMGPRMPIAGPYPPHSPACRRPQKRSAVTAVSRPASALADVAAGYRGCSVPSRPQGRTVASCVPSSGPAVELADLQV